MSSVASEPLIFINFFFPWGRGGGRGGGGGGGEKRGGRRVAGGGGGASLGGITIFEDGTTSVPSRSVLGRYVPPGKDAALIDHAERVRAQGRGANVTQNSDPACSPRLMRPSRR